MVRLGKVSPQVWENLQSQGLSEETMDAYAEEVAEEVELMKLKAAELAKEALNKVGR